MIAYLLDHARYANIIGIFAILAIAFLFSRKKKAISGSLVAKAFCLQVVLGVFVLKTGIGQSLVQALAAGIASLYRCADSGIQFLFGPLAIVKQSSDFIFAVKVLPVIIFFGAFMGLLFHLRIIQTIVYGLNCVMQPLIGSSGAETLCAVANSFLGQTEAPLLIRHYLANMTSSELLVVMVSGMGTISGAILATYASMGVPAVHMLTSSIMAIPGTILIAKILLPETEKSHSERRSAKTLLQVDDGSRNVIDAIARGTSDGLMLALNIGAMLLAFLALIGMVNTLLTNFCSSAGCQQQITLQVIFGWIFAPFSWMLGLRGSELMTGASLIGTKVAVNEMVAYIEMVGTPLSERALILLTYALCGFSNFSCIGIQVGGIGALVPERRAEISSLGLYAVLGGTLANLLSAMIVGLII